MLLNLCDFAIFEHEIDFRDFHRKEMAVKYSAWEYERLHRIAHFCLARIKSRSSCHERKTTIRTWFSCIIGKKRVTLHFEIK